MNQFRSDRRESTQTGISPAPLLAVAGSAAPAKEPIGAQSDNPEAVQDRETADRLKTGDRSAFIELFARQHRQIYACTCRMVRSHEDTEEITQDVVSQALRRLTSFRGEAAWDGIWN